MKVAILGCGPAGLLAAHRAIQEGHAVQIYSVKRPSKIGGAQYLHEAIPELTDAEPDLTLRYIKLGQSVGYALKVYGSEDAPVSWEAYQEGDAPAWRMEEAYSILWNMYSRLVTDVPVGAHFVKQLVQSGEYDHVVSTIPASAICENHEHRFEKQDIALVPSARIEARNVVVYNGQETEPWYRTSNIGGHQWTEYACHPGQPSPWLLHDDYRPGWKPLSTDCDCCPGVARMGRFGRWQKGQLVHHAYEQMAELLNG